MMFCKFTLLLMFLLQKFKRFLFISVTIALSIGILFYFLTFLLLYAVYHRHRENRIRLQRGDQLQNLLKYDKMNW